MNLKLLLYQTKFYLIYLLHEYFIPFSLTNFLFTIILIQYKHKLSNFPNNKLHFNNTSKIINNNRSKHPCKINLPLLSPQKVRPLIHQILLNLKSSINLVTPSSNTSDRSTPHETKQQLTKRMQEAFVQMRTGGEPERLLGRYFPRFAGDQELFIVVYACVCVCVSFAITQNPRVFCFREIDGDHGDRIGYQRFIGNKPAYAPPPFISPSPLSRGRVSASRGRFSCIGVSRCTAKINSPCASELHLFVFLGWYRAT